MLPVRPLGSTDITRLLRYYGPLRLPCGTAFRLCLPFDVLPLNGSPRFLDCSFDARRPLTPRRAQPLLMLVSSRLALGFTICGRLAALTCLSRPVRVRFRYGLRLCPSRLRQVRLLCPTLVGLPVLRATHKVNSFQFTRTARLFLAHRNDSHLFELCERSIKENSLLRQAAKEDKIWTILPAPTCPSQSTPPCI